MKLLVATTNQAKFQEISGALKDIDLISLQNVGVNVKPEETGKSFEENAILKARFYSQKTRLPTLADDGGLEIEALGGWPGIYSRRLAGREADDEELISSVIEKMKNFAYDQRRARFRIAVAVMLPDGRALLDTESTEGIIALEPSPKRQHGYPYRSIFWLPQYGKYFIDLTPDEENEVNHRLRLLKRLEPKIVQFLTTWQN